MKDILLDCPVTGLRVRATLPQAIATATHVALHCPSCGRMHLVDAKSGKPLPPDTTPRRRRPPDAP